MTKVLSLIMCMIVTNSSFAATKQVVLGRAFVVKRTTTLSLAKLLETCAVDESAPKMLTHFKCQVNDDLRAPTDTFPSTVKSIASKAFGSSISPSGGVGIYAGGGEGFYAEGSFSGSVSLSDVKTAVTQLFEENKLEGKKFEFYVHVLVDRAG